MTYLALMLKDPMFSSGQITFGIIFFVAFCILISFMYIKDKGMHKKNYKGVKWILLGFIAFIILLFVIKIVLKK